MSDPGSQGLGSSQEVLPGLVVEPFTVTTPTGDFTYDPANASRPAVVLILNPVDPFQRAMWSSWSLQMFLREAPLYAADYLFVPYTWSGDAAIDYCYYMYSRMMEAAREVYGNNDTTDEELRRRVFAHVHFVSTPGLHISGQVSRLLKQWSGEMRVLTASVTVDGGGGGGSSTGGGGGGGGGRIPVPAAAAAGATTTTIRSSADAGPKAMAAANALATMEVTEGAAAAETAGSDGNGAAGSIAVRPVPWWQGLLSGLRQRFTGGVPSPSELQPRGRSLAQTLEQQSREFRAAAEGSASSASSAAAAARSSSAAGAPEAGAEPAVPGLAVGRLDAWYGWLPSPTAAGAGPAPLAVWTPPPGGSPCDVPPAPSQQQLRPQRQTEGAQREGAADGGDSGSIGGGGGGGGVAGAWALVFNATREAHPECTYSRAILAMQLAGAKGVIFVSNPDQDVEVITPDSLGVKGVRGANGVSSYDASGGVSGAAAARDGDGPQRAWRVRRDGDGSGDYYDSDEEPSIPATMVAYTDGLDLVTLADEAAQANSSAVVEFGTRPVPVGWFVADPWVGLQEAGWAQLPTMQHAGWAAWWHVYLGRLKERLGAERARRGHRVVEVFRGEPFPGPHGATAVARLPRGLPRRYNRLLLDFALGCEGAFDASCPAWDHMVQLFACCDPRPDRCAPCPTTLWRPRSGAGGAGGAGGAAGLQAGGQEGRQEGDGAGEQRCGLELGRWATPFRRRVGRWLTDVTPLLAALGDGGRCAFTVQTAPWADGNWTATLSLRLSYDQPPAAPSGTALVADDGRVAEEEAEEADKHAEGGDDDDDDAEELDDKHEEQAKEEGEEREEDEMEEAAEQAALTARRSVAVGDGASFGERPLRPISLVPLFGSAAFDASYNRNREPVSFTTPYGTRRAVLVSYITGHGSDKHGCGEFCPTSHHFFVNGIEAAVRNMTDAGTAWGCADAVLYGSVPNQHGTWFYGRGGWCDGAAVEPWAEEVDVGHVLRPEYGNNTVWYKGLYGGSDPEDPPEGFTAGYIMMQSLLVFYGY
ncbi:hypothetical protein GPECTOR_7g1147 [Gonium pectorale]|uniref:Peptide-N-glycosidase F N-terminal domain-containing protein n=1 Tax=Gonium pectorale TaxID=33097 RepID=A0A150GU30_GONPE|nr:hypothetical protein GPECTOR_7g1147 [Gonium pectorale]|eukprot:KXZ53253.1 hypothetical protein GPECTOR_7g1147 [Gonium pectorale]